MKQWLKKLPIWVYFFVGAAVLVGIDLLTKWIAQNNLTPNQRVEVIPNFLYWTLSYNTKIAFSLGIDGVGGRILNIAISLVMSVAIPWYWIAHDKKWGNFARVIAMLIFAGALGNLIDRSFYWSATTGFDGVIDFVQFYLGGGPGKPTSFVNPFATFNLADAFLVIGVILMIIYIIIDAVKNRDRSLESDPRLQKAADEAEAQDETVEK